MERNNFLTWRQFFLSTLSLFTSFGTLVCCALPALLVTVGMGASLISILGVFPWITVISEQKKIVFIISGIFLSLGFVNQYVNNISSSCPTNENEARICKNLKKVNWIILFFSSILYIVGLFFAFFAAGIFY
tara:strand:+ start:391 stop:786 length:396 start_codon:yes stop_codon:yes gene_type:complete